MKIRTIKIIRWIGFITMIAGGWGIGGEYTPTAFIMFVMGAIIAVLMYDKEKKKLQEIKEKIK